MLLNVWDLIKFGIGYYLFIALFVVLWFVFNDELPHLIYISVVGYVTVRLLLESTFAQRLIILIPIVIIVALKFIVPKVL